MASVHNFLLTDHSSETLQDKGDLDDGRVQLRVYDLANGLLQTLGYVLFPYSDVKQIYHTGVVVYGYEYFYSGGILKMKPCDVEKQYNITPIRVAEWGRTNKTMYQFKSYLSSIHSRYTQDKYDLLYHNCNHFSNDICQFLLNRRIPDRIIGLPDRFINSVLGGLLLSKKEDSKESLGPLEIYNLHEWNRLPLKTNLDELLSDQRKFYSSLKLHKRQQNPDLSSTVIDKSTTPEYGPSQARGE